jgi:hypothetical protein
VRRLLLAVGLILAAGAAQARIQASACAAGLKPQMTAELVFGADIPGGGSVSDADWAAFLDHEVTPRFPDGLTTWDSDGRWLAPGGVQTHEKSRVLWLILSGKPGERALLEDVRAAYKTRYRQMSVMLVEHRECVGF